METSMSYGSDYHGLPVTSIQSGTGIEVRPDLYCLTVQIVNLCFVGHPNSEDWVLVDAGMPGAADFIIGKAEKRFGSRRPKAIILTHGHFDHVGSIIELVEKWDIPVYAHPLEMPYLTGALSYPKPDPTVEGGMVAKMSPLFPIQPIQLGGYIKPLPEDGHVPDMPGWRWIHTPGHSPGHVSFFRDSDLSLIAGDAFVTVKQDSLYKVFTQEKEMNGPPRYLTTDWRAAKQSVMTLEALKPAVAVTGHGVPMQGAELTEDLSALVRDFDAVAVPDYGKYVN